MSNDIRLFYYGGSGGFFCLHLLLLTGYYQCVFEGEEQDFLKIFQNQWNIKNIETWKSTEIWPDNDATLKSELNNKVYHLCSKFHKLTEYPGKTIVLYTDIKTQWFLAMTKNAWVFSDRQQAKNMIKSINNEFLNYYRNIKAIDWPECDSIYEFKNLSNKIKTECLTRWKFNERWPLDDLTDTNLLNTYRNNIGVQYKNEQIYNKLIEDINIEQIDIVIKLQDLIKTNGDILFDQLGIKGNSKCKDFTDLWLSKHTPEQLKYLIT